MIKLNWRSGRRGYADSAEKRLKREVIREEGRGERKPEMEARVDEFCVS